MPAQIGGSTRFEVGFTAKPFSRSRAAAHARAVSWYEVGAFTYP